MSKNGLAITALAVLSCILLVLAGGIVSAQQDVLRLDGDASYVLNLETGSKQTYVDFLRSKQYEGVRLEFNIRVSKTGNPILDTYVLELRTNLDNPEWKFGDDIYHAANVLVWKGAEAHEALVPTIVLSGDVPKPIKKIAEPGFEAYDIYGIGEGEVYVELTVGTTRDGATLATIIQKLEPSMTFYSTTEKIQDAQSAIERNLEEARGKIGETALEADIRRLAEQGHPGWASILSEHYTDLSVQAEPPPLMLYALLSMLLGLIVGAAFVYIYVSRGAGKGVDVSQISAALNDTSGRLEEKSSTLNTLSVKFARSEDEEKRSVARELIKIRAGLSEISNEIRTIADKIKGSR
ncbi:MAG TPA: hypothetical protein ENN68_03290 [Methanomicrobia archaeon]|nr:hypothetical protein [Methanomicrobia archaeon]